MAWRRVSDKIALIAGPFLVVYLLALLLTTYLAQADLRDASLREAQYRLDLRAAALGHFHAARIQEIEALTEDPVLHNYFANRALGMSMQYGMRASQLAVQARVDHLLRDHRLGGAPVYRRLSLIENDGGVVVDRTAAEGAPLPWDARLADAVKRPQLRLLRSGGIDRLAVVAPYLFKGVRVATLIAEEGPQPAERAARLTAHKERVQRRIECILVAQVAAQKLFGRPAAQQPLAPSFVKAKLFQA